VPEHGGDRQQVRGRRFEFTDPPAHTEHELGRDVVLGTVAVLADDAGEDLGREERVAADTVQQSAHGGRRRVTEPVGRHRVDVRAAQRPEFDGVALHGDERGVLEVVDQPVDRASTGEQPHDRATGQPARQRTQDESRHRIDPLRVVDADQQGSVRR
jgi:hypothetical protein